MNNDTRVKIGMAFEALFDAFPEMEIVIKPRRCDPSAPSVYVNAWSDGGGPVTPEATICIGDGPSMYSWKEESFDADDDDDLGPTWLGELCDATVFGSVLGAVETANSLTWPNPNPNWAPRKWETLLKEIRSARESKGVEEVYSIDIRERIAVIMNGMPESYRILSLSKDSWFWDDLVSRVRLALDRVLQDDE